MTCTIGNACSSPSSREVTGVSFGNLHTHTHTLTETNSGVVAGWDLVSGQYLPVLVGLLSTFYPRENEFVSLVIVRRRKLLKLHTYRIPYADPLHFNLCVGQSFF
jgi:hypothetical protein